MSEKWHDDHKKAIAEKWTQCPPVTVKVKELIGGQVCMGTYGLVELEVMQLERELAASKADRVTISQKLSDALDALFASNKQLAGARAEVDRLALEIENQQYTITCASEENQQLKESLAEARAEIDKLNAIADMQRARLGKREEAIAERDRLIEQMRDALKALKQRHYVNDDDNWHSCPASGLCGNDHAGTDCNCGADHANSIIQAALRAADGGK